MSEKIPQIPEESWEEWDERVAELSSDGQLKDEYEQLDSELFKLDRRINILNSKERTAAEDQELTALKSEWHATWTRSEMLRRWLKIPREKVEDYSATTPKDEDELFLKEDERTREAMEEQREEDEEDEARDRED